MNKTAVAERPKESLFYGPVLYLIGKISGYKPYVGVHHKLIRDDALRLAGIDPENCPWPLKDTSTKVRDGLYRVVSFGWYHQTRQYRPDSEALCCHPLDPDSVGKRGYWALTELGIKKAKALRSVYEGQIVLSSGPNVTAEFLGENWERMYKKATTSLRRKMPRSHEFDKIDDHVMNWVERIMQRDGLKNRIQEGKSLAPSHLAGWIRKSAYTEIRNEGREPVCRVFHGALTPKEYQKPDDTNWTEQVIPRTINDSEFLTHHQYTEHSEDDGGYSHDLGDLLQDNHDYACVEDTVANSEAFDLCLTQIAEVLRAEVAAERDPEFHLQLVHDRFIKGMTVREIAAEHGLNFETQGSKIRAALNRVRKLMTRARDNGSFDEFLTH